MASTTAPPPSPARPSRTAPPAPPRTAPTPRAGRREAAPLPDGPREAGRRRHEVPTHLDVQDRLFLGLSSRQAAYVLIGLAGAVGLWGWWPQLPPPLRLALALACAGAGAALAFVRWRGHGLEAWAVIGLRYAVTPRRAVWRAGGGAGGAAPAPILPGPAPRGRPAGAVQGAFVGLESIAGDTVRLSGGRWRAVLEVTGVDFELRRADEQEALVAAFGAFLNGLTFPIQALVRVQPVDLEGYLQRLEGHARRQLGHDLAILAHDHLTYLRRLGGQRALLERRCYVVVPADPAPGAAPARSPGPAGAPRDSPSACPGASAAGAPREAEAAHQAPPPATTPPSPPRAPAGSSPSAAPR